jgi:hypothetical protein
MIVGPLADALALTLSCQYTIAPTPMRKTASDKIISSLNDNREFPDFLPPKLTPQFLQNLAPGLTTAPQLEQPAFNATPQVLQNRCPKLIGVPQ